MTCEYLLSHGIECCLLVHSFLSFRYPAKKVCLSGFCELFQDPQKDDTGNREFPFYTNFQGVPIIA